MSIWVDLHKQASGIEKKKEEVVWDEPGDPEKLRDMMKKGIVHFRYRKIDKRNKAGQVVKKGELRDAWGTKDMVIVSKIPHNGESNTKKAGYINYFDCAKGDWRCYDETRIEGVFMKIYTYKEFLDKMSEE